jgi:hypothetical protein
MQVSDSQPLEGLGGCYDKTKYSARRKFSGRGQAARIPQVFDF